MADPAPQPIPPQAPQVERTDLAGFAAEMMRRNQQLAEDYLREKIRATKVMNYNGANLAYNHGRDVEKKLNLPPQVPAPYWDNTAINVQETPPAPTPPADRSWLKTGAMVALGSLLTGGSLLGGMSLLGLKLATDKPPPVVEAPTPPVEPQTQPPRINPDVGFTIK